MSKTIASAPPIAEGLEAVMLLGAIATDAGTPAKVDLGEFVGDGWRVAMEIQPSESCVAQPIGTTAFLFTSQHQDGAAVYVGQDSDAADLAWARAYDAWQLGDVGSVLVDVGVEAPSATPSAARPAARTLEGKLMRASVAARYGFPAADEVVQQTLRYAAAAQGRRPSADPWILMVGQR